jgi:hypothetical protein
MGTVYHFQETEFKNLDNAQVWGYELPTWNMGLALVEFNGRHPKKGYSCNVGCEFIYYILSGQGQIFSRDGVCSLKPGDVYHFKKNEKYYLETDYLKVLIPSSPGWQEKDSKLLAE